MLKEYADSNKYRVIKTTAPNEKKNGEMLASIVGQMSDGIWENSNAMIPYWKNAICDSRISDIIVLTPSFFCENFWDVYRGQRYARVKYYKNPYYKMSNAKIVEFMAKKIKQIARIELNDQYEHSVKEKFYKARGLSEWINACLIPTARIEEFKAADEEVKEYLAKNPFVFRGKFNADNTTELVYLNYYEKITVADAYTLYKILMKDAKNYRLAETKTA